MRDVTVDKQRLREALAANRIKHKVIYRDAITGYHRAYVERLGAMIQAADLDGDGRQPWEVELPTHIDLSVPECHLADYDQALEMLEWETRDEIVLSSLEFEQFINDNWSWTRAFNATSMGYIGDRGEYPGVRT